MSKIVVVVPNWNKAESLKKCLESLRAQSLEAHIIVVDNGSTDESVTMVQNNFPNVELIRHDKNKGYAGGVNPGFKRAIELKYDYAAPFNNDAVADRSWLKNLAYELDGSPEVGIAACKQLSSDGKTLDSTGDIYTTWGLPYPRGRGESLTEKYDSDMEIFGASGGASLYRVRLLEQIGLLDEDFFAYYEDVDLSFRAQLAGWKVAYVPAARVYHEMNATSSQIKGFLTYQTMKNLPWLLWKNVPASLLPKILPRFTLVYLSFFISAAQRGQLFYALKGSGRSLLLLPKKLVERSKIQHSRKVGTDYIKSILTWDLPPNAERWRNFRAKWQKLTGKARAT